MKKVLCITLALILTLGLLSFAHADENADLSVSAEHTVMSQEDISASEEDVPNNDSASQSETNDPQEPTEDKVGSDIDMTVTEDNNSNETASYAQSETDHEELSAVHDTDDADSLTEQDLLEASGTSEQDQPEASYPDKQEPFVSDDPVKATESLNDEAIEEIIPEEEMNEPDDTSLTSDAIASNLNEGLVRKAEASAQKEMNDDQTADTFGYA